MIDRVVIITGVVIGAALLTCAAICAFSMADELHENA